MPPALVRASRVVLGRERRSSMPRMIGVGAGPCCSTWRSSQSSGGPSAEPLSDRARQRNVTLECVCSTSVGDKCVFVWGFGAAEWGGDAVLSPVWSNCCAWPDLLAPVPKRQAGHELVPGAAASARIAVHGLYRPPSRFREPGGSTASARSGFRRGGGGRLLSAGAGEVRVLLGVAGWNYAVAAGWRAHVATTVSALSSQRRPLTDPLSLRPGLVEMAGTGLTFGELADRSRVPAVARAQLLHLIWRRRLGIDLAAPLRDGSLVVLGKAGHD